MNDNDDDHDHDDDHNDDRDDDHGDNDPLSKQIITILFRVICFR